VYGFGLQVVGGEAAWDAVWNRYIITTSVHEKDDLLYALSRTTDLALIYRPEHNYILSSHFCAYTQIGLIVPDDISDFMRRLVGWLWLVGR